MKSNKKNKEQWKKYNNLFETFAIELQENVTPKVSPPSGDQDVQYGLELQQNRLQKKGIRLEYQIEPRGHFGKQCPSKKSWCDEKYTNIMDYRTCHMTRSFHKENKRIYKEKQNLIFYQISTHTKNNPIIDEDLYNCPHCDGVSKIKELKQGCPYCGTRFKMDDLFPKVSNYFFIEEIGGTEKEVNRDIIKTIIPTMIITIISCILYYYYHNPDLMGKLTNSIITGIIAGIVSGGFFGYIIWAFKKILKIFAQAGKSMGMIIDTNGSSKRFVNQMKCYSSEFSYEYFSAKVVSLLKMILFSNNIKDLPICVEQIDKNNYSNVVDTQYVGAVALKNFHIKNEYVYVTTNVYMDVWYENKGKIRKKREKFMVSLRKNITKPIDFNFSIKKLQCNYCGGSFDATKTRSCPYCSTKYGFEEEDWIVVDLTK